MRVPGCHRHPVVSRTHVLLLAAVVGPEALHLHCVLARGHQGILIPPTALEPHLGDTWWLPRC